MKKSEIFKNEGNLCWRCGCKMTPITPEHLLTEKSSHHGIPQFLKPILNVEIPVCLGCHKEIDFNVLKKANLKTKIDGLVKYVDSLKELNEREIKKNTNLD